MHVFTLEQGRCKSFGKQSYSIQNFGAIVQGLSYVTCRRRRLLRSGSFSRSCSLCQMEGEVRLRAGELKGRWRWGKRRGRTRVTSFTWDWLEPVRTCKKEISPRGRKKKTRKRRTQNEHLEKQTKNVFFFYPPPSSLVLFVWPRSFPPSNLGLSSPSPSFCQFIFRHVSPQYLSFLTSFFFFFLEFQEDILVPVSVSLRETEKLPHTKWRCIRKHDNLDMFKAVM